MFKMKKPPNGWQLGASELPFGKQSTPIINMKVFFFFLVYMEEKQNIKHF